MGIRAALGLIAMATIAIGDVNSACPSFVFRRDFYTAKHKTSIPLMDGRPTRVVIKQSGRFNYDHCVDRVEDMQRWDMAYHNADDINCNFVMDHIGDVCEGRGWYNAVSDNKTLVLCVLGKYRRLRVGRWLQEALIGFFECPSSKIVIDPNYVITTPRDFTPLSHDPGHYLYLKVRNLPHYKEGPQTAANEVGRDCPHIFSRADWRAKPPRRVTPFDGKPSTVLVKEIAIKVHNCRGYMQDLQDKDMGLYDSPDIDCNFVLGMNGDLCEGRGWNASVLGNKALVLCVSKGYNSTITPRHLALETGMREFFNCTMTDIVLDTNYEIITLRDTTPLSNNPNLDLYMLVRAFPHYKKSLETDSYDSLWRSRFDESDVFG